MADIQWPDCISFAAIQIESAGIFSFFMSDNFHLKVFSVSGGQVQYSFHPNLKAGNLVELQNDYKSNVRQWTLKEPSLLDGFKYDPRNPDCHGHACINGGLLNANIEVHSPNEITITAELEKAPLKIRFMDVDTAEQVIKLIKANAVCCKQKMMEAANEQVKTMQSP